MFGAAELEAAFGALLKKVAGSLEEEHIEWMLIGGLAVGAWTTPRGTKDVDLALAVPDRGKLEAFMKAADLEATPAQLSGAASGGVIRAKRTIEGQPPLIVDLLCAGTDFEREALSRRQRTEVFGTPVWIVSPDDLLLYKLIAGRPQDMADVDRLIRIRGVPEDAPRVRRWAEEWQVDDRLDRAIESAKRS